MSSEKSVLVMAKNGVAKYGRMHDIKANGRG